MASFHKILDKNGRTVSWYVMYYNGFRENGKQIQHKKRGFATKKDAELWWNEQKKLIEKGVPISAQKNKITLSEWLDIHMNTVIVAAKTAKTHESYLSIQKFWIRELGHIRLSDLSAAHVQKCVAELVNNGKSSRTIRNYVNYLRKALNDAVQQDFTIRNPILNDGGGKRLELPKIQNNARNISWTIEDFAKLLSELENTQYYASFYLEMNCGARKGELLGIKWSDVDFNKKTIHIHQARMSVTKSIAEQHKNKQGTKTHQDRFIHITNDVIEVLKDHKQKIIDHGYTANGDDYVFVSFFHGTPLSYTDINRIFNKLQDKLKLRHIRFHDLRHLYASFVVDAGIPISTISSILGHSKISTTSDIYTHEIQRKKQEYANQISNALGLKNAIKTT